jgi:hypothetical protein
MEDFDRFRAECGNKSAVNQPLIGGRVAIFAPPSTGLSHGINLEPGAAFSENTCSLAQKEAAICESCVHCWAPHRPGSGAGLP